MNSLRQVFAITVMNLRSISSRLGNSLVICTGIAGVVAVLITVLAMAHGLTQTMSSAGHADRAIVLRKGATAEAVSTLDRDALVYVNATPGLGRLPGGGWAVSPETLITQNLLRADDGQMAGILVRGITPAGVALRTEIKLTAGRLFRPGLQELIAGRAAQQQFRGLHLNDEVKLHNSRWRVVGTFSSAGDVHESELIGDAEAIMSIAQRTVFSAATVQLQSPLDFAAFKQAVESSPSLKVDVQQETEYYARQSQNIGALLGIVANTVGAIMAIGALFGALNTMYSAVSTRSVEIATLRAIGFSSVPVVVSILAEALLLALIGAALGCAISWWLFNGFAFSTGDGLGQVAVQLDVGLPLILTGALWACIIGLVGGLFPAVRAARMPVAAALNAA